MNYLIALTPLWVAVTALLITPIGLHYANKERADRAARRAAEVPAEISAFRHHAQFAYSGIIRGGTVTVFDAGTLLEIGKIEGYGISGKPEQSERPKQPLTIAGRAIAA